MEKTFLDNTLLTNNSRAPPLPFLHLPVAPRMDLPQKVRFLTKQCQMQQMMLAHIQSLINCAPKDVLERQVQDVENSMMAHAGDAGPDADAAAMSLYFPVEHGYVYVLRLEGDDAAESYFYVGFTQNVARRMGEHFSGQGAEWTKVHRPVAVAEVAEGLRADERTKTLEYMRKHGWARTRGYCWTSRVLRSPPKEMTRRTD